MPGVPTKNGEPFGSPFESGRRGFNPRPPEPPSGALPGCATSRYPTPDLRPVNSQQVQDAQTHSGCQQSGSRSNRLYKLNATNLASILTKAKGHTLTP